MERKLAERQLGRRPRFGHVWLSWAALAAAIVLSPSAGICGQQSIQASLQATLTVVSDSGTLSIARVAGDAATGTSTIFAVHPRCSPSCIVFIEREHGLPGSQLDLRGSRESTPESLLVTPETDTARLALPAGSNPNAATLLIYY